MGAVRWLAVRTTAGPRAGFSQSSRGMDRYTGPAGGWMAIVWARMNAAGTSSARAGWYTHFAQGSGISASLVLVRYGSQSASRRSVDRP